MKFDQPLFEYVLNATKSFEESLDSRPVAPDVESIKALDCFDEPLADNGINAEDVIKMLHRAGEPGVVSTRGGRYFGFVNGGTLPVTVASNWMATSWDQNSGLSVMSPTVAKIEEVAGKWVLDILDLPKSCGFGFVTGSTMAGFTALCAARNAVYKKHGYNIKEDGIRNAPKIRFVMSAEIHPTNIIALQFMGYGKNEFEYVKCDKQGRMITSEIPTLDDHTILLCQAGNVNSGSFDPFNEICDLAEKAGAWVHVDTAFGGWVRATKERAHLADGMDRADSWSLDCHKWLNVPYDSAIAICRDKTALEDMYGVTAAYLVQGSMREPNYYTPEFSRRARGVDIWAALKYLGKDGLAKMINQNCDHAKLFSVALKNMGFEILNEVVINQVVVTMKNEDDIEGFIKRVQEGGQTWFGPTLWRGRKAFRISISSHATTDKDIEIALKAIKDAL